PGLTVAYTVLPETAEGFPPDSSNKVWELNKALYGLKQSAREWNCEMDKVLENFGLQPVSHEPCLYVKKEGTTVVAVLALYVDDLVIAGLDLPAILHLKELLASKFELSGGGPLQQILGERGGRRRRDARPEAARRAAEGGAAGGRRRPEMARRAAGGGVAAEGGKGKHLFAVFWVRAERKFACGLTPRGMLLYRPGETVQPTGAGASMGASKQGRYGRYRERVGCHQPILRRAFQWALRGKAFKIRCRDNWC
ncbi:MAG: reverse transcriptase (RNA-dependent DNA polymerase)-domain-containing protein, partial [Olpidium bornovanus]